nr:ABC transporter permease [Sphingomonas sp. BGYR3]
MLLLALAVASLVLLLIVSTQLGSRLERDAQGIDLVVGAKGSPLQLILSSIYHLDQPTGNIPLSSIETLRANRAVARVVPLALGDNFRGYRIVGTEPEWLDIYAARIAQGRVFAKSGEAVIGTDVVRTTGAAIGQRFLGSHGAGEDGGEHAGHPFTVTGILAPTGTVADRLILTPVESVWDVHGIAHAAHDEGTGAHHSDHADDNHDHSDEAAAPDNPHAMDPEVTALLVTYRSAFGAVSVPGFINRQTEMQAAVPAVETGRLLSLFGAGVEGARLFAWLLAGTGGLAIFVALLNAARAREGDLALLRVMGATPVQVFGTIVLEGVLTALAGALVGIAAAHGIIAIAVDRFRALAEIGIDPLRFDPAELGILTAVLAIGASAALVPALRVFRIDLATTLSRN